jgi:hypothetical protein
MESKQEQSRIEVGTNCQVERQDSAFVRHMR